MKEEKELLSPERKAKPLVTAGKVSDKVDTGVSRYQIWNDTGYPIIIKPKEDLHTSTIKELHLEPNQKKDLLVEHSVDEILTQSVLYRMRVSLVINLSPEESIEVESFDVHQHGVQKIAEVGEGLPIISNVYPQHHKKIIRISSPMILESHVEVPLFVQIHHASEPTYLKLLPNESIGIPVDKLHSQLSMHLGLGDDRKDYATFLAKALPMLHGSEVKIGDIHAIITHKKFDLYSIIGFEPLITITNSLPCPITLNITAVHGPNTDTITQKLASYEQFPLIAFGAQSDISMTVSIENFTSNNFILHPIKDSHQELHFEVKNNKSLLKIHNPTIRRGPPNSFIIAAKTCIINETNEKLLVSAMIEATDIEPAFSLNLEDGREVALFSDITGIKLKAPGNNSILSDKIKVRKPGIQEVDLIDGQNRVFNVLVKVIPEPIGTFILF